MESPSERLAWPCCGPYSEGEFAGCAARGPVNRVQPSLNAASRVSVRTRETRMRSACRMHTRVHDPAHATHRVRHPACVPHACVYHAPHATHRVRRPACGPHARVHHAPHAMHRVRHHACGPHARVHHAPYATHRVRRPACGPHARVYHAPHATHRVRRPACTSHACMHAVPHARMHAVPHSAHARRKAHMHAAPRASPRRRAVRGAPNYESWPASPRVRAACARAGRAACDGPRAPIPIPLNTPRDSRYCSSPPRPGTVDRMSGRHPWMNVEDDRASRVPSTLADPERGHVIQAPPFTRGVADGKANVS